MRRLAAGVFAALILAAHTGCGGAEQQQLRVAAASSLQTAFTKYAAESFPNDGIHQSFAGSDTLAAQIEQGARPDVFASANTTYPQQLYEKGLVEKPIVFARNRLVLAVPADSDIHSLSDIEKPGTADVIGDPDVPIGSYTREVLGRLPAAGRNAILDNVRSQEPEVSSIVGKLTEGAADAGFIYVTDVRAAGGKLRAIPLPASLQPDVAYGIAIVKGAPNPELAQQYVEGLMPGGKGASLLGQAGFQPPH